MRSPTRRPQSILRHLLTETAPRRAEANVTVPGQLTTTAEIVRYVQEAAPERPAGE